MQNLLFKEKEKKTVVQDKIENKKTPLTKETAINHLNVQDDGLFTLRCLQSSKDLRTFKKAIDAEIQIKKGTLTTILSIRNLFMTS